MNKNYDPETCAPDATDDFVGWDLFGDHIIEEAERGAYPATIPVVQKK